MGRVVEKAIELRLGRSENHTANRKSARRGDQKQRRLLELAPGDQLELKDIQESAKHPSVRPAPLYSGTDDAASALSGAQLYFGPGFENRLEMEMEELVAATTRSRSKRLSTEELEMRKKEDKLFAKLASRPLREMTMFPEIEKDGNADVSKDTTPPKQKKPKHS